MEDDLDWAAVLAELSRIHCGSVNGEINVHRLALILDTPRSTVRGWLEGAEPRFCHGLRIFKLLLTWHGPPLPPHCPHRRAAYGKPKPSTAAVMRPLRPGRFDLLRSRIDRMLNGWIPPA